LSDDKGITVFILRRDVLMKGTTIEGERVREGAMIIEGATIIEGETMTEGKTMEFLYRGFRGYVRL
jgi:hypothetical protein